MRDTPPPSPDTIVVHHLLDLERVRARPPLPSLGPIMPWVFIVLATYLAGMLLLALR